MDPEPNGPIKEQDILTKIRQLGPQHVAEVLDFIDFLAERKQKESPFVQITKGMSGHLSDLEDVRRRLSKIPGKMSETIRELRNERG